MACWILLAFASIMTNILMKNKAGNHNIIDIDIKMQSFSYS